MLIFSSFLSGTDNPAELCLRLCYRINALRTFDRLLSGLCGGVRSACCGIVEKFVKARDFAVLDRYDMREIRRVLFIGRFRAG